MIGRLPEYRIPLGWGVAVSVLLLACPTPVSLWAGLPVALAGLAVRSLAAGTIRKGSLLAQTGPYALTRNPLYLGSSLLALGFGIMSGSFVAAALLVIVSAAIYPPIIRKEESELHRQFGREFDDFRKRVPCFIPRRITLRLWDSFSTRQFITNREYNAVLGFLAATGILVTKYLLS